MFGCSNSLSQNARLICNPFNVLNQIIQVSFVLHTLLFVLILVIAVAFIDVV